MNVDEQTYLHQMYHKAYSLVDEVKCSGYPDVLLSSLR